MKYVARECVVVKHNWNGGNVGASRNCRYICFKYFLPRKLPISTIPKSRRSYSPIVFSFSFSTFFLFFEKFNFIDNFFKFKSHILTFHSTWMNIWMECEYMNIWKYENVTIWIPHEWNRPWCQVIWSFATRHGLLKSFNATGLFLYILKTLENLWPCDGFRGYRKRSVAWNGLNK